MNGAKPEASPASSRRRGHDYSVPTCRFGHYEVLSISVQGHPDTVAKDLVVVSNGYFDLLGSHGNWV